MYKRFSIVGGSLHLHACLSQEFFIFVSQTLYFVARRRIGRVDTFRPGGHRFESRSSRHVRTLGKSFSCASACKLRHSVNFCGRERFWKAHTMRSAIETDKYNTDTIQIQYSPCLCCIMSFGAFLYYILLVLTLPFVIISITIIINKLWQAPHDRIHMTLKKCPICNWSSPMRSPFKSGTQVVMYSST